MITTQNAMLVSNGKKVVTFIISSPVAYCGTVALSVAGVFSSLNLYPSVSSVCAPVSVTKRLYLHLPLQRAGQSVLKMSSHIQAQAPSSRCCFCALSVLLPVFHGPSSTPWVFGSLCSRLRLSYVGLQCATGIA